MEKNGSLRNNKSNNKMWKRIPIDVDYMSRDNHSRPGSRDGSNFSSRNRFFISIYLVFSAYFFCHNICQSFIMVFLFRRVVRNSGNKTTPLINQMNMARRNVPNAVNNENNSDENYWYVLLVKVFIIKMK